MKNIKKDKINFLIILIILLSLLKIKFFNFKKI